MVHPFSADIRFFSPEVRSFCYIKKYKNELHCKTFSDSANLFWVFKGSFNEYGCNFDNVSKIGYSRLFFRWPQIMSIMTSIMTS